MGNVWLYTEGAGFTLGNSLFGTTLTKSADYDKFWIWYWIRCTLKFFIIRWQRLW